MKVTYINHMGDDLTVVNAARVSFAKKSEWENQDDRIIETYSHEAGNVYHEVPSWKGKLSARDISLISYLAANEHWTPFAHPQISLHFKVPFFVAAQIKKHQVGFVVNEVSRRYVDSEPELYKPEVWRKRADNVKQGSSDEVVYLQEECIESHLFADKLFYKALLERGVCPEQARMVLPLSTYTEFWMTGSLYGWSRLYSQRTDPNAQRETAEVARQVGEIIAPLFPASWRALVNE